ncbi:MAG: hypothetical protein JWR33_305 [Naasia sp.]|nr:hypothetical protein [Naasia sp.]
MLTSADRRFGSHSAGGALSASADLRTRPGGELTLSRRFSQADGDSAGFCLLEQILPAERKSLYSGVIQPSRMACLRSSTLVPRSTPMARYLRRARLMYDLMVSSVVVMSEATSLMDRPEA